MNGNSWKAKAGGGNTKKDQKEAKGEHLERDDWQKECSVSLSVTGAREGWM